MLSFFGMPLRDTVAAQLPQGALADDPARISDLERVETTQGSERNTIRKSCRRRLPCAAFPGTIAQHPKRVWANQIHSACRLDAWTRGLDHRHPIKSMQGRSASGAAAGGRGSPHPPSQRQPGAPSPMDAVGPATADTRLAARLYQSHAEGMGGLHELRLRHNTANWGANRRYWLTHPSGDGHAGDRLLDC